MFIQRRINVDAKSWTLLRRFMKVNDRHDIALTLMRRFIKVMEPPLRYIDVNATLYKKIMFPLGTFP